MAVDTLGHLLALHVTLAHVGDRQAVWPGSRPISRMPPVTASSLPEMSRSTYWAKVSRCRQSHDTASVVFIHFCLHPFSTYPLFAERDKAVHRREDAYRLPTRDTPPVPTCLLMYESGPTNPGSSTVIFRSLVLLQRYN
jgi:hypothetical protein